MEVKVIAKYVGMPPTKVGVVLDSTRGKSTNEALATLKYAPKDAAEVISKALKSAVANAENSYELDANKLFVVETYVGHGPTLRRFRPMDHGKVFRINKKTSNTVLIVKKRA